MNCIVRVHPIATIVNSELSTMIKRNNQLRSDEDAQEIRLINKLCQNISTSHELL